MEAAMRTARFVTIRHCSMLLLFTAASSAAPLGFARDGHSDGHDSIHFSRTVRQVIIPPEDRFTPFNLIIRAGDSVEWVNQDSDDHTVVSDDVLNKGTGSKSRAIDQVVKGTDNNDGQPGTLRLRFKRPGTFVYHCRFHAHVDDSNQPVAPGPGGDPANPTASGITGNDGNIPNTPVGNLGTPMMGIITVVGGS
jgi:plastocyanin